MDVDLEGRLVSDDEDGVAEFLEPWPEGATVEAHAGDDEVRAIAVAAVLVVRARIARGRVVRHPGRDGGVSAQARDHAGEDHDEAVGPGVDDAGLAQDLELIGSPGDRGLPLADRVLEQFRQQDILLDGTGVGREPDLVHVGEAAGDRVRHLAEDGQHRSLRRLPYGFVRRIGGARERRSHQHRVDELARPAGQLLRCAADDLAEDDTGVASRTHQRCAGESVDQLGATDLIDHLPVEAVELVAHRAQRERHVVARVAIGDREDIEVVDLLAALLQMGRRGTDDSPESLYRGIGHGDQPKP